jgi:hypothetical protein
MPLLINILPKSILHNSCVLPKTLYPGGIRTRVFCSWGGCNVHWATPPRLQMTDPYNIHNKNVSICICTFKWHMCSWVLNDKKIKIIWVLQLLKHFYVHLTQILMSVFINTGTGFCIYVKLGSDSFLVENNVQLLSWTGWPDRANFRPMGDCSLRPVFMKIAEIAQIFWLLCSSLEGMYQLWQNLGRATFWVIFCTNSSGHPGLEDFPVSSAKYFSTVLKAQLAPAARCCGHRLRLKNRRP